jgi:hypothetical protein
MEHWPANTQLQSKKYGRKPHEILYDISKCRGQVSTGRFVPGYEIVAKVSGKQASQPQSTKQCNLCAKDSTWKASASLKH